MLDFKTLIEADFSELSGAVDSWKKTPKHFRDAATKYRNTVEKDLQGADWDGEAATAATEKLKVVEKQLDAAGDEADDVYKLLSDAHEIFTGAQSKLRQLKHDVESDKYLSINSNGDVYFDPPEGTENVGFMNKGYQDTIQAYRASIQSHLSAAQDADDTLSWALSQDHNGRKKGFDSSAYKSIASAKKGHEQAEKDLKELEKLTGKRSKLFLAGSGDQLDPEMLKRINTLMSRHEGDPEFAEKFATHLGGKGTLELWTRIADRRQNGDAQTKESANIQKSLSFTLATASHSHSQAMNDWKKNIISLGGKQVEYMDMGRPGRYEGPYGFQVMSSLMRYGSYDDKFLNDYGHGLIGFEKEHKGEKPADLWRAPGDEFPCLNFDSGNDYGQDPMAGYMESLGHNPEAAKELFYSEDWAKGSDKIDPDLKYLMVDRDWFNANTTAGDQRGFGYDELGHALQAATLGVPYDQMADGVHRDDTTANIMGQVVKQVGEDPHYIKDRPGVGNSLGVMGAAYIDDLNWSLSNFGDDPGFRSLSDQAFEHHGPGHMNLGHQTSLSFLNTLGQHKVSYDIMSSAQQEFTVGALKAHGHPDDSLSTILGTGTKVSGALDQARMTGINDNYQDKSDDYSDALSDAAEWKKYGVSTSVSSGVSLATLPLEGAGKAVSFVVPGLVEGIGGAIETHESVAIDQEVRRQEDAYNDKLDRQEIKSRTDFIGNAQTRAMSPLSAYLAAHPELKDTSWYHHTKTAMEQGYNSGVSESDLTDTD
ncbi:hypothetical protein [Streptomyces sp. NPDC047028]|uniref:hypothetical protein n=1 Tax=Streptomyces sp. NPDC047028 TaxID=3155793 RepID=UPI0033E44382